VCADDEHELLDRPVALLEVVEGGELRMTGEAAIVAPQLGLALAAAAGFSQLISP
jgi:hypothetical protein